MSGLYDAWRESDGREPEEAPVYTAVPFRLSPRERRKIRNAQRRRDIAYRVTGAWEILRTGKFQGRY